MAEDEASVKYLFQIRSNTDHRNVFLPLSFLQSSLHESPVLGAQQHLISAGGSGRTGDGHPRRGSRGYRGLLPPDSVCGDLGRMEEQELRRWHGPEREHHGRGKGHRVVRWWIHNDR